MQALRAIFFDIGDTLVFDDPPLRERLGQAMAQTGLVFPQERLPPAFRAGEDYALFRYLTGLPYDHPDVFPETLARVVAALELPPLSAEQSAHLARACAAAPFTRRVHPGAVPVLETLRARGFVVGAVSDWEETLPQTLAELGLAPHLDALAVSALVGVTKPDPRLFAEALHQAGVEPSESLHIGDWYELDVCGARAAGMRAALFDHQGRRPDADCARFQTFDQMADFLLEAPYPASGHLSPLGRGERPVANSPAAPHDGELGAPGMQCQDAQPHKYRPFSPSEGGKVAKPDRGS